MYRVGFGDFFLVTVSTNNGPKHILIDCGVHAGNIGTIDEAIADMATFTNNQLALIIVTHRHADHISGFATSAEAFGKFAVEAVWMATFEDPSNTAAVNAQANLVAVASTIQTRLAARSDVESGKLHDMMTNITGDPPLAAAGHSLTGNALALHTIHSGFADGNTAYGYYKAGDKPVLPASLVAAGVSAEILGPPSDPALIAQMDNKNHQYLVSAEASDTGPLTPFRPFRITNEDTAYRIAFERFPKGRIIDAIENSQPDALAAAAKKADNTINNQSLVVHFTINGKRLLFVGDAQWGSWENFLFGGAISSVGSPALTKNAASIMSNLDFFKVGHHGSTNANPEDAVNALRDGVVAMCSTEPGAYGSVSNNSEVPRGPLLDAFQKKTANQLVRSDQIAAGTHAATKGLAAVSAPFTTGALYIEYSL